MSLCPSVFLSVPQSACNNSAPTGRTSRKCYIRYFLKICRENSSFIKMWQQKRLFHMTTNTQYSSYLAQLFLEWELFQTKVVEKIKTHFMFNNTFSKSKTQNTFKKRFFENRVYEIMWKNMTHAHCILDTYTLWVCNTLCFSTVTLVARTRLNVMLHVHC
jgi:hypothetical protein